MKDKLKKIRTKELDKKAYNNLLTKHLIIHGDASSGKSLLVRLLLRNSDYATVSNIDSFNPLDTYYWNLTEENKDADYLVLDDLSLDFRVDCFYTLLSGKSIKIETQGRAPFRFSPKLILKFKKEIPSENISNASTLRRFHIINTNTISYKEIIEFIRKWNNNEPLS